jgi:hypothetical protein
MIDLLLVAVIVVLGADPTSCLGGSFAQIDFV